MLMFVYRMKDEIGNTGTDEEVYGNGKIVVTGITFLLPAPDFFYPGSDVHVHTRPLLKERML